MIKPTAVKDVGSSFLKLLAFLKKWF